MPELQTVLADRQLEVKLAVVLTTVPSTRHSKYFATIVKSAPRAPQAEFSTTRPRLGNNRRTHMFRDGGYAGARCLEHVELASIVEFDEVALAIPPELRRLS